MNRPREKSEYSRPPIVEAVIAFIFEKAVALETIEKAAKRLSKHYLTNDSEVMFQAHFDVLKNTANSTQKKNGNRLTSQDRSEIVIVHLDNMAVGQLAPYPGWDTFVERAKRDYSDVKREVGHRQVKRIGVRFINRIDIPLAKFPDINPAQFCRFVPARPPFGSERLQTYTLQVSNELEYDGCRTQVTTAKVISPVPDMDSILLDIDVFCEHSLPDNDKEMWELIGRMRQYKNEIFEACVTDDARSLFL